MVIFVCFVALRPKSTAIVLPAKSDSDVMFCLHRFIGDLESMDQLCINPIRRIG